MMKRKMLSILLALCMVCSLLPTMAFAEGTAYDLYVGGVRVTDANKDNIVVPGATGSATFDPVTNTLMLDNFSYTGEGYNYTTNVYALIYSKGIDLKIVLKGTNTLAGADRYQEGIIIENGSLTIANSDADDVMGSLKLTATYPVIGVANGSLFVENVNLTVINTLSPTGNPGDAIFVIGNILITNSDVTAISGDSDGDDIPEEGVTFGIMTTGSISVANSTVSAIGYAVGIGAGSLSVANSTVTAAGNFLAMADINTEEGLVPNLTGDYVVYAGDDAGSATEADASADATYANKYVKIVPVLHTYDIWVGGVQVTSANKDDLVEAINQVANPTVTTGSATYDPTTKTLTLTDFKYTGGHFHDEAAEASAIRVKENGITIVFSGENMIEGTGYCGLYADVGDHIKLKAADKNSTLTFTCENGHAFSHNPEFVGSIAIYAGESEADAKFRTLSAFAKDPHPYDFKYVKFVPATPTPPIATPTPSVKMDVEDATLNDAAKAVGSAVKSGNADIIPAEGYTKESIAKMQNSGELNLVIEKNAGYDEAEKKLLDDAITAKGGAAGSVMYLEIDALLMSDDGKVVAEVDDTIMDLTITVELNAEMQKAAKEGKTIYVARAHDGKVTFIEGTLNAEKTQFTFDSSKFSTYALVASDSQTVTSPKTADAGIFMAVSMSILSVTGSAVLLKKKED